MGLGGHGTTMTLWDVNDPRVLAMWNTPAILRAFWRGFYDIINGPLNNSFIDPILDAKALALRDNNVNFDPTAVTTIKSYVSGRRAYLAGLLTQLTNTPFAANATAPATNVNTVTLYGTAGVQVYEIRVNDIAYPVNWVGTNVANTHAPTNWAMTVTLNPGNNALNIQTYNSKGRAVPGTAKTVNVQYNGPGISPQGSVVFSEIMYHSSTPHGDFVEIANTSTNFAFDVSGWRVEGLDFTFPSGTVLTPGSYVVLVENATAFANVSSTTAPTFVYSGSLDNGGETLTLTRTNPVTLLEEIVDKVKYDDRAPWPAAADGGGASISVIDLGEDRAHVSNWTDAQGWRQVVYTGIIQGSATFSQRGTNFFMFMNSAGSVNIDDMYLCFGAVPETGPNLLVNGDFESPLSGIWTLTGNHINTVRDTSFSRTGAGSLRIVSTGVGSTSGNYIRQFIPGNATNATYTLSFWVFPTTTGGTMTIRTAPGSQFTVAPSIRPVLSTPGGPNTLVRDLPPYPPLWLNEVQAVNQTGIADNFGDRDPWIELYNSGSNPISLDGYYLANNFSTLTQWPFPPGSTINPHEFKIVWADGETGETAGGNWHTSFGLTGPTGSVALVRLLAGGEPQIVDYLNYAGQAAGRSYGSYPDGQLFTRQLFITPTPGGTNIVNGTVFINEWMAANGSTIQDPADLRFEDWIELYNASLDPVDLSGYTMTDSPSSPQKYRIPDGTTIPGNGFLFIWADNQHFQETAGQLHASFALSSSGEQILLFSPIGVQLDRVDFRGLRQTNDISMGRYPDGAAPPYVYMTNSTPLAPNRKNASGGNQQPSIDPIGDKYVILGQTLHFTVAGHDPDGNTLTYSMTGAPSGATLGQSSGVFQFTPTPAQTPSDTTVTVTATDNGVPPLHADRTFVIHVSPPPTMSINNAGAGAVSVGFPTVPGKNYQIQYKDNVQDAAWTDLGAPHLANGFTLQINDNFNGPHRFYRILVVD